ncbi:MAG TPA: hypothetical protein VIH42_11285 [Thermoguttaceae bacterium]
MTHESRRDLRIEDVPDWLSGRGCKQWKVVLCGVKYLQHRSVREHFPKRGQVDLEWIDSDNLSASGELHQAQLGIVPSFPMELAVDRNLWLASQPSKECVKVCLRAYHLKLLQKKL